MNETKPKKSRRRCIIAAAVVVLVACVVLALLACTEAPTEAPTARVVRWVIMDGTEEDGSLSVPIINVWNDYETRASLVCRVKHDERVQMVERSGDGVLIVCPDGTEGWVTYWFIRELK